jgi:hypothetical protein
MHIFTVISLFTVLPLIGLEVLHHLFGTLLAKDLVIDNNDGGNAAGPYAVDILQGEEHILGSLLVPFEFQLFLDLGDNL